MNGSQKEQLPAKIRTDTSVRTMRPDPEYWTHSQCWTSTIWCWAHPQKGRAREKDWVLVETSKPTRARLRGDGSSVSQTSLPDEPWRSVRSRGEAPSPRGKCQARLQERPLLWVESWRRWSGLRRWCWRTSWLETWRCATSPARFPLSQHWWRHAKPQSSTRNLCTRCWATAQRALDKTRGAQSRGRSWPTL